MIVPSAILEAMGVATKISLGRRIAFACAPAAVEALAMGGLFGGRL